MTLRIPFSILVAAMVVQPAAHLQAADSGLPDAPRAVDLAEVTRLLSAECESVRRAAGIPSISIALLKNDEVVWSEAFGFSNVKLEVPATPKTIYCTGSCFKPVTAMAVMQLVGVGQIALDDPVNNYLGEHAVRQISDDEPITVRHLLSHYAGLPTAAESVPLWQRNSPASLRELAAEMTPHESPGVKYEYSNLGYSLAGLLIEEVSGLSYEEYIVERILKPLGVDVARPINPGPEMIEELALPYRLDGRRPIPEAQYRLDVYPAGEAYLSVPAMSKVLLTHLNGGRGNGTTLISEAAVREMRTPQYGGTDGLDFGIREFNGETLIMHGGGVRGYSTKFILGVDSKVGVYIACNAGRVNDMMNLLAQVAIDLLLGNEIGSGLVRQHVAIGIGLKVDETTGDMRITYVSRVSPAGKAGLAAGLVIEEVNGEFVEGHSVQECVQLMDGPIGTEVRLTLKNPESMERTTVTMKKDRFLGPG